MDIWTFIHLLAGVALAFAFRVAFHVDVLTAISYVGIILIGWEIYEWVASVPEPFTNSIIDLAVGFVGVWIAYAIPLSTSMMYNASSALVLLIIWGGLNITGWFAWKARHEESEKQFIAERAEAQNTNSKAK